MVMAFCFPGKEWVCIPCGYSDAFFVSGDRREVERAVIDDLKEKWSDDIHSIAIQHGARCSLPIGECAVCEQGDKYEFKYYRRSK
jgi:hypothetical protein